MSPATVSANRLALSAYEERAEQELVRGAHEQAAVTVQTAGTFAWMNHTGTFGSDRLERVLDRIGDNLPPARHGARTAYPVLEAGPAQRPWILHVATQLYGTGGHTQFIRCWAEQDDDHDHHVVLTRQGGSPIPDKIREVFADDHVHRLDDRRGGLLERAAALRALAVGADAILVHAHNYDVVPTLAFRQRTHSAPVILTDHNDHTFWLGRTGADLVMHMRESGRALAQARRGIPAQRSWVLERPLRRQSRERSRTRAQAKEAMGLDPSVVLIVTAADGTKFRGVGGLSFLDLIVPVLQAHPTAALVAAGPGGDDEWTAARVATGGRVTGLGMIPSVTQLLEAADIYVDSFPFSSLTSLLEAGSLGTPVVTFRGHPESSRVLGADTRELDDVMLAPTSQAEFTRVLGDLIDDEDARQELGGRTVAAIVETYADGRWQRAAHEMYAHARSLEGPIVPGPVEHPVDELDTLVALVMERTGHAKGVAGADDSTLGLRPWHRRLATIARMAMRRQRPRAAQVLHESAAARIRLRRRG